MSSRVEMSTLCYLQQGGKYLMLHRTVKKNDVNRDKWLGVGGHFEPQESPEECVIREVREETGYTLEDWRFRGIVTFVCGPDITEYMFLYTSEHFSGSPSPCDEGELAWVDIDQVWKLNIWAGDKIFFRLLDEEEPFFSLKLVYTEDGRLIRAQKNGAEMELFDLLDEQGNLTGEIQERGVVHREGFRHRTVHTWVYRRKEDGIPEVLLQLRSPQKDSWPGCYDVSSAGHIDAGEEPLPTALRELSEELGAAPPAGLKCIGTRWVHDEETFHGRVFKNHELVYMYLCGIDAEEKGFHLQKEEISAVRWMPLTEIREHLYDPAFPNCLDQVELDLVASYLLS